MKLRPPLSLPPHPFKVYYAPEMSGEIADACAVDGLTDAEYRATALRPFADAAAAPGAPGENVFLANNDYVAMNVHYMYGDWAEESLLMAERALSRLGAPKPEWLDDDYYREKVVALA